MKESQRFDTSFGGAMDGGGAPCAASANESINDTFVPKKRPPEEQRTEAFFKEHSRGQLHCD